jgi:hypothetical protein
VLQKRAQARQVAARRKRADTLAESKRQRERSGLVKQPKQEREQGQVVELQGPEPDGAQAKQEVKECGQVPVRWEYRLKLVPSMPLGTSRHKNK